MLTPGKVIQKTLARMPLTNQSGEEIRLSDYTGRWLVVYFYPKDSTPGCTTEGLDFNALLPEFAASNATVLGVSRDSVKSHANFCQKQGFAFDLISDADGALCEAFGVWRKKKNYGREYDGIVRSTFLLDPDQKLVHVWDPVKVKGHAQDVLTTLKQLSN
ncbi:peroxiredoxin [Lysobacter soyae]|jgi:peroxiredoxin Q/BCP|uniref:thioredoxin-dependent peroxiredoxin n=1 Tax=Lysobacter soyae TaxID=2764185 RepID=A0ABX8WK45_9GAMM|nr:peroxiredoxin [Lysobacter sp. CJ11]